MAYVSYMPQDVLYSITMYFAHGENHTINFTGPNADWPAHSRTVFLHAELHMLCALLQAFCRQTHVWLVISSYAS